MKSQNKPSALLLLSFTTMSSLALLTSPHGLVAQQSSEQPSTTSPTPTPAPEPATGSCYRIDLAHSGAAFSGLGSLGFNGAGQTFQYEQNGSCLANKINSLYSKFVYRYFPNPNDVPPGALGAWQEACKAECSWRAKIANEVIDPTWDAAKQERRRNQKLLHPLLSKEQYLNPPLDAFCSAYGPCDDALSACKVRCMTTQNRQCFYHKDWCVTNDGTQQNFCSVNLKSGNELCKGEVNYADDDAVIEFMVGIFNHAWPSGTDDYVTCSEAIPASPPANFVATNCKGMTPEQCDQVYTSIYTHTKGHCVTGTFTLDANCMPLTRTAAKLCTQFNDAFVRWLPSSPISLIWTPGTSLRKHASIVSFKVDPSSSASSFSWFASSDTPLLVYDPEHKGVVSSAQQLFGNWAFGGRSFARASGTVTDTNLQAQHAQPWRDGYEALATLDTNDDGLIMGEELAPLALWFDKDRDAHSQDGEIRDIRSMGVTALFLGPTRRNALTGDVSVARGFTRLENGRVIDGETIDWFSDNVLSSHALINTNDSIALPNQKLTDVKHAHGALPAAVSLVPLTTEDPTERQMTYAPNAPLTGMWVWQSDKEDGSLSSSAGMIAIRQRKDGTLELLTISELPVADSTKQVRAFAKFNLMTGAILSSDKDGHQLRFGSIKGDTSTTNARLDSHSGILTGTTTQQVSEVRGTKTITYRWSARKLSLKLPAAP